MSAIKQAQNLWQLIFVKEAVNRTENGKKLSIFVTKIVTGLENGTKFTHYHYGAKTVISWSSLDTVIGCGYGKSNNLSRLHSLKHEIQKSVSKI